jgi:hypothetical protein
MTELDQLIEQLKRMAPNVDAHKAPVAHVLLRIVLLQNDRIKQLEEANMCAVGPAT